MTQHQGLVGMPGTGPAATAKVSQLGKSPGMAQIIPGQTTVAQAIQQAGFNPANMRVMVNGVEASPDRILGANDLNIVLSPKINAG